MNALRLAVGGRHGFTVISSGNNLTTVEREARAEVASGREARGHGDSSLAPT